MIIIKIILAEQFGFCFGVKRAVDLVLQCQKNKNKRIYTLGPLIHNNDVINSLKQKNIYPIEEENLKNLKKGDTIIIRSHGVSLDVLNMLKNMELEIVDATCPYVKNIQEKVKTYYDMGYKILIVGDKNHPEVQGINGWCNNSAIVARKSRELDFKNLNKICAVSQTTEKEYNWNDVIDYATKNSDASVVFKTICNATEFRQKAACDLSKKVDFVIVIGGKNSSNTTKLYEICKLNCKNAIHIENSLELSNVKFNDNIKTIGITAGASTPDFIIENVINTIKQKTCK